MKNLLHIEAIGSGFNSHYEYHHCDPKISSRRFPNKTTLPSNLTLLSTVENITPWLLIRSKVKIFISSMI